MIDIRLWRHAVALAKFRSFSRAAEAMCLSQPAFSRSIARLEELCDHKLFERSRAGIELTSYGASLIAKAEHLLGEADRLEALINQSEQGMAGSVAFGAGPMVASLAFPALLARIATERPELSITTMVGPAPDLLQALKSRRIDFAVFAKPQLPLDTPFEHEFAGSFRFGLIVRAEHPLASRAAVSQDDILPYPIVSSAWQNAVVHGSNDELANAATRMPEPTIICENFDVVREAVADSDLIWVSSQSNSE